jgi:hypothetical protein
VAATATTDPNRAATLTAAPSLTPSPTVTPTATLAPSATSTAGPSPTATSTSTPRPTATVYTTEGFATEVKSYEGDIRGQTGLSEADVRHILESQLFRDKLQAAIGADVATTAEQVHARHILVADEATAQTVLVRLAAGEDFATLAAELSTDTSPGGDLGFFGKGEMVAEFETAASACPLANTASR